MPILMPGNILNNILKGKLADDIGWGNYPSNLLNCTDGDIDTVTGTGSTVMGASGNYGMLIFDLGNIKTVMIGARVGVWSTADKVSVLVDSSDDNANWRTSWDGNFQYGSAAEAVGELNTKIVTGRYVRVRFYIGGAATCYAKIYEIAAWELAL